MKMLLVVVLLFGLFFSAAGYLQSKNPELFNLLQKVATGAIKEPAEVTTLPTTTTSTANINIVPVDSSGNPLIGVATYEEFSPEKIRRASTAPVVLFFHASWCPSCLSAERILQKKITTLPPGVSVLKIDYDSSIELKNQYNVTFQHTFIQVDPEGKELARWNGGAIDGILANLVQ